MYHYLLYGLTICSDLYFPQLISCNQPSHIDVIISQSQIPDDIKEKAQKQYFEIGESCSWFINQTLLAVITNGSTINYEIRSSRSSFDIQTYLLGFGFSLLFQQRNLLAIHCSALSLHNQSILISGESGAGKSTLTTSLLEQGYQLQGDDLVMAAPKKSGQTIVYPGFPYQKLCRDAVIKKSLPFDDLIYIDEDKDKFLVPCKEVFNDTPTPLKAIYLLVLTNETQVTMKEITGVNKLFAMQKCLFLRKLYQLTSFPPAVIKNCIEIANQVPVYVIQRPVVGDTVEEIRRWIRNNLLMN